MRLLLALAFAAIVAVSSARPATAAIPEPPPYPWEYLAPHAVAFLPIIHQGVEPLPAD